jgi:hypothetical protein
MDKNLLNPNNNKNHRLQIQKILISNNNVHPVHTEKKQQKIVTCPWISV